MNIKTILGGIIAFLFVAILGIVVVRPHVSRPQLIDSIIGNSYLISEMRVVTGSEFSVTLADGRLVHAFLAVSTPPEATKAVIKKLNESSKSYLEVKKRLDTGWVVDIMLTECSGASCHQVSLTTWLKESKLAWE